MEYEELLHRCFRCGYCKLTNDYYAINCPPYRKFRFETFSPGGRMWLIRAWLNDEVKTSERLGEILYSCATCGNCMEHCVMKFKDDLVRVFMSARAEMVDRGLIPPLVRDYLKNIYVNGNPYKRPENERALWAKGIGVETYNEQEYLFYIGCVGSYDERAQKIAGAVSQVFQKAGVSFGILGSDENCDGNEVKALGENGLFEYLADGNIKVFDKLGIKKIITLSPHGFNAIKNLYPAMGGHYEVWHYTQIIAELIAEGRLKSVPKELSVTYHDPCYLGRHNKVYEAPRLIIESVPGIRLVEMEQNREDALCCGGGGGNFFTDILGGGPESPARIRVRQACKTGADILAVACPQCAKMLEDASRAEGIEEHLKVMDAAELIL